MNRYRLTNSGIDAPYQRVIGHASETDAPEPLGWNSRARRCKLWGCLRQEQRRSRQNFTTTRQIWCPTTAVPLLRPSLNYHRSAYTTIPWKQELLMNRITTCLAQQETIGTIERVWLHFAILSSGTSLC